MQDIHLGPHVISERNPPVFVAEIGSMFNQDVDLAFHLIEKVATARDMVPGLPLMIKTEILNDPDCCLDDDSVQTYQSKSGERKTERYRDIIERKILSLETYAKLLKRCHDLGLSTIVSVYNKEGAEFAVSEGVSALKTASGNITQIPLIRHTASLGKPFFIDTGKASLGEIERAVLLARQKGNNQILVQHSPDGHPANPQNHNLRSIQTLQLAFDVHVGLSCHSEGTESLLLAVALGAKLLEKNIVFDDLLLEQDYSISENIRDLPNIIQRIELAWLTLGNSFRDPQNITGLFTHNTRSCLVARIDLKPGDVLSEKTIRIAFPCKGIPVERYDDVMNWHIRAPVSAGTPVGWHHVEP